MILFAKKVQAIVASSVAFILTIFLTLLVVLNIELSEQNKELNILNHFTSLIVSDVDQSLKALNNIENKRCSPELLVSMQKVLITSKFIKETGLVSNSEVLCNTSAGLFTQPKLKAPNHFDTGRNITIYVDTPLAVFEDSEAAPLVLIAESEVFYVAIERSYLNLIGVKLDRWEVVHYLDGKVNHIFGKPGVFDEESHIQQTKVSLANGVYSSWCDPYTHYCSAFHTSWLQVLKTHTWVFTLVSLLATVIAYIVFIWFYPFFYKQNARLLRVQSALKADRFYCVYQPIVELQTGSIIGYEMLSRLKDRYGVIDPNEFVPEIKHLKQTWSFTMQQLKKAIKDISCLPNSAELKLSFNLFPEDLTTKNVEQLIKLCKQNADLVNFNMEIIEDEVLDTPLAAELIELLAQNAIQTSLDDFGTGYSNLSKLGELSCDYVKIDRAFISNIESGSLLSGLVPQIQQMAMQFDLKVVAEGVEVKAQESILLSLGIQYGQGWYYGKPRSMSYWRRNNANNGNSKTYVN